MGGRCCSCCCGGGRGAEDDNVSLTASRSAAVCCRLGAHGSGVSVAREADAALREKHWNARAVQVGGSGSVAASCCLDCDTARWEVKAGAKPENLRVGVVRMPKNKEHRLETLLDAGTTSSGGGGEGGTVAETDSWFLKGVEIKTGDVIGVYWDQTDLPMLSFTLNGKLLDKGAINRIKPSSDIYPAVSVTDGATCVIIFDRENFVHPSLSSKFDMIICATSII